jgi:hypothetical protein
MMIRLAMWLYDHASHKIELPPLMRLIIGTGTYLKEERFS